MIVIERMNIPANEIIYTSGIHSFKLISMCKVYIFVCIVFLLSCKQKIKVVYPTLKQGVDFIVEVKDTVVYDILKVKCKFINNSDIEIAIHDLPLMDILPDGRWPWIAEIQYAKGDTISFFSMNKIGEPIIPNEDDYVLVSNNNGLYEVEFEIDFTKLLDNEIKDQYEKWWYTKKKNQNTLEYKARKRYFQIAFSSENRNYGNYSIYLMYYDRWHKHKKALIGPYESNALNIKYLPHTQGGE